MVTTEPELVSLVKSTLRTSSALSCCPGPAVGQTSPDLWWCVEGFVLGLWPSLLEVPV